MSAEAASRRPGSRRRFGPRAPDRSPGLDVPGDRGVVRQDLRLLLDAVAARPVTPDRRAARVALGPPRGEPRIHLARAEIDACAARRSRSARIASRRARCSSCSRSTRRSPCCTTALKDANLPLVTRPCANSCAWSVRETVGFTVTMSAFAGTVLPVIPAFSGRANQCLPSLMPQRLRLGDEFAAAAPRAA